MENYISGGGLRAPWNKNSVKRYYENPMGEFKLAFTVDSSHSTVTCDMTFEEFAELIGSGKTAKAKIIAGETCYWCTSYSLLFESGSLQSAVFSVMANTESDPEFEDPSVYQITFRQSGIDLLVQQLAISDSLLIEGGESNV